MARTRLTVHPLDDRLTPVTLPPGGFAESVLVAGLDQPTGMAVAPDGRIFVTEQTGGLRVVSNGQLVADPAVRLTVDPNGERGLLGIALDPEFQRTGFAYVYYTVPAQGNTPAFNRVSRLTVSGNAVVPGSEAVLLNLDGLDPARTNHNGGGLKFGPDGKLYIGVGENAIPPNAQSLSNRLGKVLRINPNGTIPADNPTSFAGISGTTAGLNRAIWAVGFRNPYSLDVDPVTGRVLAADVGQNQFEEVDDVRAGGNYGWPATEGFFDPAAFPAFTGPVHAYAHSAENGSSIVGGTFYRPAGAQGFPPDYAGDYFFADFTAGRIDRIDAATGQVSRFATGLTGKLPTALAVTPQGDLLYAARGFDRNAGTIYRVRFTQGRPVAAAGDGAGGSVAVLDPSTGAVLSRLTPFGPGFAGGVRVATADVTGDRVPDLVAGAGPGGGPRVTVFDGATGQVVRDLFAFEPTFTGGVYVAAADVDRDGLADLVVSADVGGGPRVRVFAAGDRVLADFFAFETTFTGGARVAAGDVNGDGFPDLVVAAGFGGGPRVAVFSGRAAAGGATQPARVGGDFFAFESSLRNGAFVAAPDLDADGYADIVVGAGPSGGPRVVAYGGRQYALGGPVPTLADFFAGDPAARGGVTVGGADADGDGVADLVTSPGPGSAAVVSAYKVAGGRATLIREVTPFDPPGTGGVFVG